MGMRTKMRGRRRTTAAVALAGWLAAGCASLVPGAVPLGTPIDEALQSLSFRTGDHPLPGGGRRLEYAKGAFGRQTWMLDFDAAGRLVGTRQVLTEADFATIAPGMKAAEVRTRLGRPADVFNVGWQRISVWNYRWFEGDCVWFQVSIDAAGTVTETGYGQDPACNAPNDSRD